MKNPEKSTVRLKRSTRESSSPLARAVAGATHEAIARRAYELYLSSGSPAGRDVEFWLEAEKQLKLR